MNDLELTELFFSDSAAALKAADEKYGGLIKRISSGNGATDVQACCDAVYKVLSGTVPPLKPRYFAAYLCKIARRSTGGALPQELTDCLDASPEAYTQEELDETLNEYLGKLETEAQVLFVQRYFAGESEQRLAALYGLGDKYVTKVLAGCRRRLKKALRGTGATAAALNEAISDIENRMLEEDLTATTPAKLKELVKDRELLSPGGKASRLPTLCIAVFILFGAGIYMISGGSIFGGGSETQADTGSRSPAATEPAAETTVEETTAEIPAE